ncbi:hypothetical protein [Xylella fastidiosa]|uniref:Uncharacterized protein n=2 Tax=Xylella fastidiosa TaxID=2371 RepID=A0AAW6HQE8_XYLFS|nr:hypothetical protein [Xylella fastidiosa]MDC6407296.1 hypothetical protein [Xylella fastidiosa subsp. multiplex]MDC6407301.1 hypothetical protein [Xylella fastidiosa subsp. multiplex]MDD0928036.1 hypothetical protein [Xylella fastidiosa subsp. multiplex]RWA36755.1 hypothetical protein XfCFBP8078_11455 [Xylella fastidiosa subsp. multiplex]WCF27744.1 hypothetical protein OK117_08860 [Xylella fastidiosa subsp. fastidiosa]
MSNQYKKAVIDDVESNGINEGLQENLLDLFESSMKKAATTLIHSAELYTTDFFTSKERGCDGFKLSIKRIFKDSRNAWHGVFQKDNIKLTVIGHLEECN